MAQFCNKNNQLTANTFDSNEMFACGADISKVKESTYFNVLDIFRKALKDITYRDLLI